MSNFFKEIGRLGTDLWHGAEQLGGHGVDATKWLIKDMPQEIIDAPGRVNDELSRGLNKIGVGGWVGDNPLEAVGAAMVAVIGGAAVAGGSSIFGASSGGSSIFSGGGAAAGGGAPVVDAVGQSALDAILSGGGSASELGSVSSGLDWGSMLSDVGRGMNNMSGQQQQQQQQGGTPTPQLNSSFTPTPIDNSLGQMQWQNSNLLDLDGIISQLNAGNNV